MSNLKMNIIQKNNIIDNMIHETIDNMINEFLGRDVDIESMNFQYILYGENIKSDGYKICKTPICVLIKGNVCILLTKNKYNKTEIDSKKIIDIKFNNDNDAIVLYFNVFGRYIPGVTCAYISIHNTNNNKYELTPEIRRKSILHLSEYIYK